ncbi:MAG: hypothetical protein sL5_00210 [Candidatus Mesenet longicola]|uniref:Bacteriophage phiJL001 Gp84 C-terminal domain-containing protein n=1 Tax=Candidatus Mesenet longicola TaxID=1892558 RepID=A0A8J3MNJ4_9RICK|nr:MAG: hypothetical protein sGL2_00740 [Candidatus Mesenet longicola]GHM59028.1 MAG: hypothetical protein sL5_00210 [Candidatus Mesenet longicola]
MKSITKELKEHLSSSVLSIATCWKLTLTNNEVMGFTDYDKDLTIDNIVYQSHTGFTASAIVNNSDLAIDNLEIEGVLSSNSIKEEDILAGKYDFAQIEIFLVNYNDLSQGSLSMHYGTLGRITLSNGRFVAQIHGLSTKLTQNIGKLYSTLCRAEFCDNKCKLDNNAFTKSGVVTSVINNHHFQDENLIEDDDYYKYGIIKFANGANSDLTFTIREYHKGNVTLFMQVPHKILKKDQYFITAGCDKKFLTCKNKFNNIKNFRGEPHIPRNILGNYVYNQ